MPEPHPKSQSPDSEKPQPAPRCRIHQRLTRKFRRIPLPHACRHAWHIPLLCDQCGYRGRGSIGCLRRNGRMVPVADLRWKGLAQRRTDQVCELKVSSPCLVRVGGQAKKRPSPNRMCALPHETHNLKATARPKARPSYVSRTKEQVNFYLQIPVNRALGGRFGQRCRGHAGILAKIHLVGPLHIL
jgi:hypothetical protein